ncbi:MAG: SH3 domain-containing protein [Lawsonibacter sp.]|nr:SH3 domain-containing protein [Lawsonibacter sp.]
MKQTTRPPLSRRLAALVLAVLLAVPAVHASAGEQKLQTSWTLTDGLEYINTVTYQASGGRTESFALDLSPDSAAYPIMVQGSGTIYSPASVNAAVEQAQSMGYHVLAAVNTDFFVFGIGVPMGIVIEDGIFKSGPEEERAVAVTGGGFRLVDDPSVSVTLTNQRDGTVTNVHHLNKGRASTGGVYLLNEHFSTVSTRTSTPGWMVRLELLDQEELTVNSRLTLRVTELIQGSDPVPIGEGNYILTSDDQSGYIGVYDSFQEGDLVTLETQCLSEDLSEALWACGVGDVMVRDGALTDTSDWVYVKDGRDPRSALGVRADGSVLLYTVDGRRSGYSAGLSQEDLARELLDQGCQWAVNLDGGGSTAMSVWVPGQAAPAVVNRPSDGRPRGCASYLLLVTDDAGDGRAQRLALKQDGPVVLTGSSVELGETAALDSGLNLVDPNLSDVSIRSLDGLGTVEGSLYTAGNRPGTDTLTLRSGRSGLRGTAQVHVVDELTELTVTRQGSDQTLSALSVKPGEQIALDAQGSYWSRPAMRDSSLVVWAVEGDVGTIDENGLFTAAPSGTGSLSGSITASAGGLTRTIPVSLSDLHSDVDSSHWAYEAVEYCYEHQLVSGISPSLFGPDLPIRRGDFLLMLHRAAGSPPVSSEVDFPDVLPTDYYASAIAWAQENGLASGMADGTFSPGINVTREQAFTIFNRALPLMGIRPLPAPLSVLDQFQDKGSLASWAAEHTASLVYNGLVGTGGGVLRPQNDLTRAEMAVLLYNTGHYDSSSIPAVPGQPGGIDSSGVESITLSHSDVTLSPGDSFQLAAVLGPQGVSGQVSWTVTGGSGAACVDPDGRVTNLNTGTDEVEAVVTASCNGLSASCAVRCPPAPLSGSVSAGVTALNVRSGPGTEYPAVDQLAAGVPLVVLEQLDSGWLRVRYPAASGSAGEGYLSSGFVTLR